LGRPLYEKLGFVEEYELVRYEGVLPRGEMENAIPSGLVVPVGSELVDDLVRLDREVTKLDRRRFLEKLWKERPDEARAVLPGGRLAGFLMARTGTRALQLGPCMANSDAGLLLLDDAHHRHAGETIFLDFPTANSTAVTWAEMRGLGVQRPFLRMCRG